MTAPGSVLAAATTVPASLATTGGPIPPARVPTTWASPAGGSRQSAAGASSAASASSGSGRAEVKSRSPSGRNAGPDSPVPRVSLRAGRSPAGSISHSAVRKRVRFGSGVATVVTSRAPSGDTARPANRGRSWKACRSPHAVTE